MINAYVAEQGRLKRVENFGNRVRDVVWLDVLSPTNDEEAEIERALGIDLPTREEMDEIEISSRLYYENGAAYMTAMLPARSDNDDPEMAPVTFLLVDGRLITVRYHDPKAFQTFSQRSEKVAAGGTNGPTVLIVLLEVIVDRLADIMERAAGDIDSISRGIFNANHATSAGRSRNFEQMLEGVGRKGVLTSKLRDSLGSLDRVAAFLSQVFPKDKLDDEGKGRLETLGRDIRSLTDHSSFLSQKITFLLDATLGLIQIEQNAIIKIFTVAAVAFLPPTLIASIYGMNFDHMPELDWLAGYPAALVLMLASAMLPFWYFKRRGWL